MPTQGEFHTQPAPLKDTTPKALTAAQARELAPQVSIAEVLGKVSKRVEKAARQGKLSVDAIDDIPSFAGWDHQRAAAVRSQIHDAIRELGYTVKPLSGGHHGSETLLVDWGRAS